ncbi:hypothetical protein ACOJQI_16445 [Bacillus salacetis]|uniref:hypothetical protein n=1 Tax=Bacillus salacetis TaxID=2315464 RepID=UPI003B9F6AD6
MNKQSTRAFAAGIFLSAVILVIFSYFNKINKDPVKLLNEEGYIILTEEEETKRKEELSNLKKQVKELSETNAEDQEKEIEKNNGAAGSEISLTVSPGMTPIEIAEELESSGIIRNASDLNSYLVNSGLANKIQIGEYKLHSEMTLEEISTLLTE